jgi:hypothetical protein
MRCVIPCDTAWVQSCFDEAMVVGRKSVRNLIPRVLRNHAQELLTATVLGQLWRSHGGNSMNERCATCDIVQDVLMFASSSPVVAIFTYMVLTHVPAFQSGMFVALAVLFSAGTFIYAACVHMMPRVITASTLIPLMGGALIPCTLGLFDIHHH